MASSSKSKAIAKTPQKSLARTPVGVSKKRTLAIAVLGLQSDVQTEEEDVEGGEGTGETAGQDDEEGMEVEEDEGLAPRKKRRCT